jgi:hypothetical protein
MDKINTCTPTLPKKRLLDESLTEEKKEEVAYIKAHLQQISEAASDEVKQQFLDAGIEISEIAEYSGLSYGGSSRFPHFAVTLYLTS